MTKKKQILGVSLLIIAALFFMLWLAGLLHFGKVRPGLTPLPAASAPGRIQVVRETQVPQSLEVLGQVTSKSLAQISAQVPGGVSKIWVEVGSRVKAGDPLITLTGGEYQARVNQAKAGVAQARAQLQQVTADYRRYQYLYKQGAVSPREFEAMEARYKSAQAALAGARAQAQEAGTLSGYTLIRAPEAGVVAARNVAVGDLAQPGQTLLSLYNPALLQVEGEVNDNYRSRVRLGEMVAVTVPAQDWHRELPLAEIFPISQSMSRTFKIRTAIIPNANLVPGMFARLQLPLGEAPGILIPQAAVRQVGQLTMVQVLVGDRAQLRQVRLGRQIDGNVEVLAGLQPGDHIIVPGE